MRWTRRRFVKNALILAGGLGMGTSAIRDLLLHRTRGKISLGFRNDAPRDLGRHSRPALHWSRHGDLVVCELCPHHCRLGENDRGYCRARVVRGGRLYTLDWANPCALHLDPVEKKPLFHFRPATPILSIACAGCNLRCLNCQNWSISQARPQDVRSQDLPPEDLVLTAQRQDIPSIAYTYTEPIIYYEYVLETARQAREAGIANVLVTAGYICSEPLRELISVIDAVTLDLKAFSERNYTKITTGRLAPVLETVLTLRRAGVWLELSSLIVPTLADDRDEIQRMCRWIVRQVGPDVPMHFLRFHPGYLLPHLPRTPLRTLLEAREIALSEGLQHVYVGNVPGHATEDTLCPGCGETLIERTGYHVSANRLKDGHCPACRREIAGIW